MVPVCCAGAGLSSSSALVVSAALALLALWRIDASPAEVAEFTCSCERFVGTQGGGMDQAVAVMAEPGVAMHVEFAPVSDCHQPASTSKPCVAAWQDDSCRAQS